MRTGGGRGKGNKARSKTKVPNMDEVAQGTSLLS
jgi:hypothetical protein